MLGAIRRMYRWGQREELVVADPTLHIESIKPRSRERVLPLKNLPGSGMPRNSCPRTAATPCAC